MTHSSHNTSGVAAERPRSSRRLWPRIAAIAAVVVVGIAVALQARATPPPTALARTNGERAPSIRLPDLVDPTQTVELEDVAGRSVARAYGLFGMPTTVFISPHGEILARRTGEMSSDELLRTIDELLLNR